MTYDPDQPTDAWVISAEDRSEAGVVWSPDSRDVPGAVTRHFPQLAAGGYYQRRLRASEITARCPAQLGQLEAAMALNALAAARAAVFGGLGIGDGERDNDLLDLVEGMFAGLLSGSAASLDDVVRQRGDDPAKVRQWWSRWA